MARSSSPREYLVTPEAMITLIKTIRCDEHLFESNRGLEHLHLDIPSSSSTLDSALKDQVGMIAKRAPRRVNFHFNSTPTDDSATIKAHNSPACPQSNYTLGPQSPLQQRQQQPHPTPSTIPSRNSSKPHRASPSSSSKAQSTSRHQKTSMTQDPKTLQTPRPMLHPTKPRSESSCSRTTRPRTRMTPSG